MNNKVSYKQLLIEQCSGIAQKVSDEMRPNMFYVGTAKRIPVPHEAILYRWWFPQDSPVMGVLTDFAKKDKELAALLKQVETCKIEGKTYYALYFGKSNNGYHRFRQHSKGNVHISTIRHTLYGLCIGSKYDKSKEQQITDILKDCYFEWCAFDENEGKLVECIESICIISGKYPLNVDGNPAISNQWLKYVMDKRKLK